MTFYFLLQLLLAVGTKLEHVITQLANEVSDKHAAIEGELVVKPSDGHFWFGQPRIVLFLIHFILFQNAFEIGFFFWIWVRYSLMLASPLYILDGLAISESFIFRLVAHSVCMLHRFNMDFIPA